MGTQIVVRIDPKTKNKFQRIAKTEGKTASEKIREMVEAYITKSDMSATIDELWDSIGKKASKRGITEADIEKTIKAVRASKKKR